MRKRQLLYYFRGVRIRPDKWHNLLYSQVDPATANRLIEAVGCVQTKAGRFERKMRKLLPAVHLGREG